MRSSRCSGRNSASTTALLGAKVPGTIDRTTAPSYLTIAKGYLPTLVQENIGAARVVFPNAFPNGSDSELSIGPIPAGTPVALLTNVRLLSEDLSGNQLTEYQKNRAALVAGIIVDLLTPSLKRLGRAGSRGLR